MPRPASQGEGRTRSLVAFTGLMVVMLVPGNAVVADHQDWEPDPPPGATHQWGGGILIERTGVDGWHPSAAGREALVAALHEAGYEPLYP